MAADLQVSVEASGIDLRWSRALQLLEDDLLRRDAAQRTRRAYGADLSQFADWAVGRGSVSYTHLTLPTSDLV